MNKGAWRAALAVSVAGVLGCAPAESVTVGESIAAIDLGRCYGRGTRCEPSPVVARPLAVPPIARCEPVRQSVPLAWRFEVNRGTPFEERPPDRPNPTFAVGRNGAVWIADQTARGVSLEHYAQDGQLLGTAEVVIDTLRDFNELVALQLAVDSQGRAYAGYTIGLALARLGWREELQLWYGRYAADATPIGGLIPIEGVAGEPLLLAVGADDALLVAAPGEDQALCVGKLDPSGNMRWTQNVLRQVALGALQGDAQGRTVLLGLESGPTPEAFDLSIALYDAQANLLWDRTPAESAGMVGLVAAPSGELIYIGATEPNPSGDLIDAVVHRIDAGGEVRNATRVVGTEVSAHGAWGSGLDGLPPVTDGAGTLYIAGAGTSAIHVLEASGAQCQRLELEDQSAAIHGIGVAADGGLFVLLHDPDTGWSIARVGR